MKEHKVFGIGFHKTGTKSLAAALRELGYSVTGPNGIYRTDIAQIAWPMCVGLIRQFDAFQDNPWPILYRELYAHCADGKFILTIRPTEKWLTSIREYFGQNTTPMRTWIYGHGHPAGNEQRYVERYERHNREVVEFFVDKPGKLLVIDFSAGHGWKELCEFLNESRIPDVPFPHMNSQAYFRSERQPALTIPVKRLP
ncbi:MAG TPA: sulfotransferase [Rhizomicrobium sp.]|nr:sulfotransferase [Rhizomicrobium sp.]